MVAEYDLQALINDAENITKLILHDAFRRGFPKTQIDSQLQKLDQLKKSIKRIKSQVNEDYDYLSKSDLKIKEFALGREEIDKYVQTLDIFRPSINFDDSELDNIKYQVTAILKMSIREAELERKLAELGAAVQLDRGDAKFINDLTELIGVHDRQVGQIEEQKREIKQKDDNLDAATAAYQNALARLQQEHKAQIDTLNAAGVRREEEFKNILRGSELKNQAEKTELLAQYNSNVESLNADFQRKIAELNENITTLTNSNERALQSAADLKLVEAEERKELVDTHNAKLQEMKQEFEGKYQALAQQHSANIQALESKLSEEYTAKLTSEYKRWDGAAKTALSTLLQEEKNKMQATIDEFAKNLKDKHKKESKEAQIEIDRLVGLLNSFEKFISDITRILVIKETKDQNGQLGIDFNEIVREVDSLQKYYNETEAKYLKIMNEVKDFENLKLEIEERNAKLIEENRILAMKLNSSLKENEPLKQQLAACLEQLQQASGENDRLKMQNTSAIARELKISEENARLNTELKQLQEKHQRELEKLRNELSKINENITQSRAGVVSSLNLLINSEIIGLSDDEKTTINRLLKNLNDKNNDLVSSFPTILSVIVTLYKERTRFDSLKPIAESKAAPEYTLRALQQELDKSKADYEKMKSLIFQTNELNKTLEASFASKEAEFERKEEEFKSRMKSIYDRLTSINESTNQATQKYEDVIKSLTTELSNSKRSLKVSGDELRAQFEKNATLVREHEKELKKLKTDNASLLEEISQLRTQKSNTNLVDDSNALVKQQEQRIKDLMAKNEDLEKELNRIKENNGKFEELEETIRLFKEKEQKWNDEKKVYEKEQATYINDMLALQNQINTLTQYRSEYNDNIVSLIDYLNAVVRTYKEKISGLFKEIMQGIVEKNKRSTEGKYAELEDFQKLAKQYDIEYKYNFTDQRYGVDISDLRITGLDETKPKIRIIGPDGRLKYNETEDDIKVQGGAQVKNQVSQQELHKLNQLVKYVKSKTEAKLPSIVLRCNELEQLIKKATKHKLDPKTKKQLMQTYKDLKLELVLLEIATSRHPHELIKDLYRQNKITSQQMDKFEKVLTKKVGGGASTPGLVNNSMTDMIIYILIAVIVILAMILVYYWITYMVYDAKISKSQVEYVN